ncbi:hypothetical protein KKA23_02610 [Patescibacteria group bacterium]|nr:hypothetical protein [Patescibacteria group bacterium]
MNEQLENYIKEQKEKGFSDDESRKALLDAGWKNEDIEKGFKNTFLNIVNKPNWLIPVIVIVGMVLIIGTVVAFNFSEVKKIFTGIEKNQEECINDCDFVKEVEVKEWETYKNETYGYEIDYPKTWIVSGEPHLVEIQTFSEQELEQRAKEKREKGEMIPFSGSGMCLAHDDCLIVEINIKNQFYSLSEWLENLRKTYMAREGDNVLWDIKEGEIMIGDKKGYEFITWISGSDHADHRVGFFNNNMYEIRAKGNNISVLFKTFNKTLEQMFSSFGFTGEDTSSQKIQRDEDLLAIKKQAIDSEKISDRDYKRFSDLGIIYTMLMFYNEENNSYPKSNGCENVWTGDLLDELLTINFEDQDIIEKEYFGKDPIDFGDYVYKYSSDGKEFVLSAFFEDKNSIWLAGYEDKDGSIMGCSCDNPAICIYSLEE